VKATVVGVGSELIEGRTLDTNTAEIARDLLNQGAEVGVTFRVADRQSELVAEIRHALERHDLVITTGGLGPTPDDLTREAIAEAVGTPLVFDPDVYHQIAAFFARLGKPMPDINKKQAMKPAGAIWLENPRGTAPGFLLRRQGKTVVALPGPPAEWRPMWRAAREALGLTGSGRFTKVFKTFGVGESDLYLVLGELLGAGEGYEVTTYAKPWGVEVVVRGSEAVAREVRRRIKKAIWGEDEDTLPGLVVRRLRSEGRTLAVMESVTGGLLASLLTDVPGVSKVFLGGMVSYTGEAKVRFGVSPAVLEAHGQVSPEAAAAMAAAAREGLGADYGLAVTGVAGPEGLEGHPVGTVFVGLAGPEGNQTRGYRFPDQGRESVRQRAAYAALAFFWSRA